MIERLLAAALRSIARIDTTDAAEFLRGVLEHGSPADRRAVTAALGLKFTGDQEIIFLLIS